ncbi:MAG: hypothetical protein GY719_22870 [bacterium]|nr:hypothetical protein [bacterium]
MRRTAVLRYLLATPALILFAGLATAQESADESFPNDYCMDCHGDAELESDVGRSMFVATDALARSEHAGMSCVDCHDSEGADFEDLPHFQERQAVGCIDCHQRTGFVWQEYFHNMMAANGHHEIPDCQDCHGAPHDSRRRLAMEIVCDRCHQEVADEYRQSYHFRKYREDTRRYPVCTTCHDPHFKFKRQVMTAVEYKHEVVDICSRCHQKDIETYAHSMHFHELESGNPEAPVCTSCHEKHDIKKPAERDSAVHATNISEICNACHPGHTESLHREEGADPALISCASCHTGHQTDMASINHAIFKEGGIFNRCNFCHSAERHAKDDLAHGEIMMIDTEGGEANCTQCHTYHWNVPGRDQATLRIERTECANCHALENREYRKSIHGVAHAEGIEEAPYCTDCHGARDVQRTADQFTPTGIIELCSSCHSDRDKMLKFQINPYVVAGYKDTYHGKLFETGTTDVQFAVCTNCHGSHGVLSHEDPESSVGRSHIVETCKACHPRASDRFVSYLVHPQRPSKAEMASNGFRPAASKDAGDSPVADPVVRWTRFNDLALNAMTMLLVGVLTVFGFHTLLWFQRGIRRRHRPRTRTFRRFSRFQLFLHILVNISFLVLAFTGLPQTYAHTDLAKWLFRNVMSLHTAQQLHYLAAAIMGLYFGLHLISLALKLKRHGWREIFTGPNTMMFRKQDWEDLKGHLRWFLGKGDTPRFDRWTYWEKFDYFAVFWGVFIIGFSGLIRWQEELFGNLLGGWVITLADTIHKEEALLATAFIFIVHFFNTHLRAEKFPMDVSIYTGRITEEEFRKERPVQWAREEAAGRLDRLEVKPLGPGRVVLSYFWGTLALSVGLFLLGLIIIGVFAAG